MPNLDTMGARMRHVCEPPKKAAAQRSDISAARTGRSEQCHNFEEECESTLLVRRRNPIGRTNRTQMPRVSDQDNQSEADERANSREHGLGPLEVDARLQLLVGGLHQLAHRLVDVRAHHQTQLHTTNAQTAAVSQAGKPERGL